MYRSMDHSMRRQCSNDSRSFCSNPLRNTDGNEVFLIYAKLDSTTNQLTRQNLLISYDKIDARTTFCE